MLSFKSHTLEQGVRKSTANARDLVETAISIRSLGSVSNSHGYGVLLMQTGLEEAAKASFLFEKYVRSLRKGQARISNREWKLWMGSRRSHTKKVGRIQYLYAVAENVGTFPNAPIMFPQSVDDMLQNRNAALYVDFDPANSEFKSPSEVVDSEYLTAKSGFAEHILNITSYDKTIDFIKAEVLPTKKAWFAETMEREISRKRGEVSAEIETYRRQSSKPHPRFEDKSEVVFCVEPRTDRILGLIYCCVTGTKDNTIFLVDERTNHFAFHPDGRVIHARFAGTTQEKPTIFRHEWEVIDQAPNQ